MTSPAPAPVPRWRHFQMREIVAALDWAAAGHIAVHETGQRFRQWTHTCHLFARDEAALREAARAIGVQLRWIQHRRTATAGLLAGYYSTHYDLFGTPLDRALARCRRDATAITADAAADAQATLAL